MLLGIHMDAAVRAGVVLVVHFFGDADATSVRYHFRFRLGF